MISSVSSSTSSSASASSSSKSTAESSYDMFLQLYCVQIQNQNPLDPMDTNDMTQQLATYSQLEQQVNTNDKLDTIISSLDSQSLSNGTGYLGRTVDADTDTLSVSDDGTVSADWRYSLDSTASEVTLTVLDSDGDAVWTGSGETSSGSHAFNWDGTDRYGNAVAAGDYTLQVTATNSSGNAVTSSTSIRGTVTAVDSSSGSTVLELGDTQIDVNDVTRLAA